MPTVCLPDDADLGQLRKQAKDLQQALRDRNPGTLALAEELGAPDDAKLSTAQLVIARLYQFPSWPALVKHLDVIAEHRRDPDRAEPSDDPATEFLRLVCLTYSDRDREMPPAQRPGAIDVWVAAACADVEALQQQLAGDAGLAVRLGGPHRWPPIAYLAYARLDPPPSRDDVLATARLLLDHGADPDSGFLWHGMPCPFTLLTGAFGGGERAESAHPHGPALARLLLEAGADPNDGQTLYNRMFTPENDHLELLFEFGLGAGDGGPWKRRLGAAAMGPREMLEGQLAWAVTHGFVDRVTLLADHGVDLAARVDGWGMHGETPYEAAVTSGQGAVARLLVKRGVEVTQLPDADRVIGAVLGGDRAAVTALGPDALAAARTQRPGLVVWAAVQRRADAVRLAVELGWDVSAKSRGDAPVEEEWETALHHAAASGDVELVRLLLDLGADPTLRDCRFDGTPLDWARHFDQSATAALLE